MTIFARSTAPDRRGAPPLLAICSAACRRLILAVSLASAFAAAVLLAPSPATAVVTSVGPISVGLAPRVQENYLIEGIAAGEPSNYLIGGEPAKYANPEGHPVLHGSDTWAIYWDPKKYYYHGDWQELIDTYFSDAAAASGSLENVFSVDAQYTDRSNVPATYKQTFRGAAVDTSPYPKSECEDPEPLPEELLETGRVLSTTCLTSTQMAAQIESYVKTHNLPTGMGNVYYLLTPPGLTVCLDDGGEEGHCSDYEGEYKPEAETESYRNSFCSYHADINPGGSPTGGSGTILYAVIPWTAGSYGDGAFIAPGKSYETPGWECQDGSYNPASKPAEQVEKERKLSKKEEEELEEKNEVEKAEENKALLLEGPHEQEPNQKTCPTDDGYCDYGLADLIINQISIEQQNIVTDPLLNGWKDPAGYENTDECRFFFAPALGGAATANPETLAGTLFNQILASGHFYLNEAFNYAAELLNYPGVPCLIGSELEPEFTAPSSVNTGETVTFDGMESDVSQDAGVSYSANGTPQANYATYTWNFGDGTPTVTGYAPGSPPCELPWLTPCAGSVFHSYEYGGTYEVTLTIHDVGGDIASVTHSVTVAGPARPESSGNTGNTGSGAGGAANGAVPAPVAKAVIASQRLRTVLRKGLLVDYSVNEQVAGHFEVLLTRALARRLHISAPAATGLPAGSAPMVVLAKAILVTTKGGYSALHIELSKRIDARLAHVGKLPLMVRMAVRNTAAATTSAVTSATLSH